MTRNSGSNEQEVVRKNRFPRPGIKTLGNVAIGTQKRLWHMMPGSGSIEKFIDIERYKHQQERLQRLGGLAAVADISFGPNRITLQAQREKLVKCLRSARVFGLDNKVAIQPMVFETAFEQDGKPLSQRARKLGESIDRLRPRGTTLFNFREPLVVSSSGRGVTHASYEAIDVAATALHRNAEEAKEVKPPSLILVMSPPLIVKSFARVQHSDLDRSGLVVLRHIDSTPHGNILDTHPPLLTEEEIQEEERIISSEFANYRHTERARVPQSQPYTEVYS